MWAEDEVEIRASDSDYLSKASASSWADCLIQVPVIGTSDLGDTDYLYFGKDLTSPNFFLRQTPMRFDTGLLSPRLSIASATIRLYIASDPAPADWVFNLIVLDSTYGTVDATDWWASGGTSRQRNTNNATTDDDGNAYIDTPLDAAQLVLLPGAGSTFDILFRHNSGTGEPVANAHSYLKVYSHQYATAALRPYLAVVMSSPSTTWTAGSPPSTTWANGSPPSTTWTAMLVPSTTWS